MDALANHVRNVRTNKNSEAMNVRDQEKVIKAGFILVRSDDHPSPRIKVKDGKSSERRTLNKPFETKAARDRELNRLLALSTVIQD